MSMRAAAVDEELRVWEAWRPLVRKDEREGRLADWKEAGARVLR